MKNKNITFGALALFAVLIALGLFIYLKQDNSKIASDSQKNMENTTIDTNTFGNGRGMGQGNGGTRQNYANDMQLISETPTSPLSTQAKDALQEALNDEYKARETYVKIMEKFGEVNPFANIVKAEEGHISSLVALFNKYGLEVPENSWAEKVSAPETLTLACQTGYDAEVANASLYTDKLLPMVSGYPDIELVFTRLMEASQNNHLKAFERCK